MKECYCIYCDKGKCTNEKSKHEDCVCQTGDKCGDYLIPPDGDDKGHEEKEK